MLKPLSIPAFRLGHALLVPLLALGLLTSEWPAHAEGPAVCQTLLSKRLDNAQGAALQRPLQGLTELKVMTYNVLNFYDTLGEAPQAAGALGRAPQVKPMEQILGVARAIKDASPDILVLQEIENGMPTLERFNEEHLGGNFSIYYAQGNDPRGIDVAVLVRKDLPLNVELQTHRDEVWTDPVTGKPATLFSRDVPTLILRTPTQTADSPPLLVVMGVHGKSMRDRPLDPESRIMRTAQYERTAELIEGYRKRFGAETRFIVAGDFNTSVTSSEVAPLIQKAGLTEALDLTQPAPPTDQRVTHTYHARGGIKARQLDGIFVSGSLHPSVETAEVYRYKAQDGTALPIPQTRAERDRNPSDHFPLVMKLKFQQIWKMFQQEQQNLGGVATPPKRAA